MENYQLGTAKIAGNETIVVSFQGKIIDLLNVLNNSSVNELLQKENLEVPNSLLDIVNKWEEWSEFIPKALTELMNEDHEAFLVSEQELQWLPPISNPRKLICIGNNYRDHMNEMGITTLPPRPYSFLKPVTTLSGSEEVVKIPAHTVKIDYEAELGVIIGKKVQGAKGQEALDCVAGYTVINDLSARDWIGEPSRVGTDWVIQKGYDGFTPIGPWVTPKQFISDPQNLAISLTVNGEVRQDSNTSNMVFSVQDIIEHLSGVMTLEPGDIIATGTPAGVAFGKNDPTAFLKAGDTIELQVEGIGKLSTKLEKVGEYSKIN